MLIGGNMAVADYKVVVVQSSGKKEAIVDIARLEYTDTINQMRTFSVTIGKANKNDYSKFNSYEVVSGVETGVIYIYRKGNLELAGIIEKPTYDKFGRLVLKGVGMEVKIEWKSTGTNKTYSNTSLDTIVSDMIGDISGIDLGTNEASSKGNLKEVNISGMSYLDGLNHAIVDLGGNEWYMTYSDSGNSSFNNVQYRGSSSSIGTLVEGIDISNVQRTKDTQRIFNKVTAIGKSEGETLISVTRQATDIDASYDMSKYGTREPPKPLVNKRIQTEEDLTKYADNFLKQHMYPVEVINFDMNDVDYPCSVGDVVTIRSGAKLQEGGEEYKRELRIISKKRIVTPNSERLVIGVTRKGLNTLPTDISTRWRRVEERILAHQTTPQGTLETLTYTHAGKANSSNKAEMEFTLPSWITKSSQIKEAKLTVRRLPLYYDVGSSTGSSSSNITVDSQSPSISGNTASHDHSVSVSADSQSPSYSGNVESHKHNPYDSGHDHATGTQYTASKVIPIGQKVYQTQSDYSVETYWKTGGSSLYTILAPNYQVLVWLYVGIKNDLGSQKYFYVRLLYQDYAGSWTYFPDSTGFKMWIPSSGWGFFFLGAAMYPNSIAEVHVKGESSGTIRKILSGMGIGPHAHSISFTTNDDYASVYSSSKSPSYSGNVSSHNHNVASYESHRSPSISGNTASHNHNFSDSGHTNPLTRGINTISESSLNFTYEVNGNTGSVGSLNVGDISSEIDVLSKIKDPSSSRTNSIKIYPTSNNAGVYYTLTIKAYKED